MGHRILLTCFLSFLFLGLSAQSQSRLDAAMRHLEENVDQFKLTPSDLEDVMVNYQYTNAKTGATYIYLNQSHKGIKIKNAIINIAINKDGKIVHVGNNFITDLKSKIVAGRSSVSPEDAVVKAADYLGVLRPETPTFSARTEEGIIKYAPTSYTNSDILVEQMYDLQDGSAKLVWQSTLNMKGNADYWEIRMDATSGEFVSKNNLTVYCTHHKGAYDKQHDCTAHKLSQTMSEAKTVETIVAQGVPSYKVYPFPGESPNHISHQLVVEPAIAVASPFGWHDVDGVDGPEFTITRGNNVHSYSDKNDDNSPDDDTPEPDGGDELVFDFEHKTNEDPVNSPGAAMTNLFYVVNMLHDITYTWGFDEPSGNFQFRNYTNTGAGTDHVLAQAFDGFELATPSLNNANFATPADGNNGIMQMFLWEAAAGEVSVDEPSDLAGFYEYGTANYGGLIPSQTEAAISGRVELVNDGSLSNPTTGCNELENDLNGKIAMIDRGLCDFSQKSYNAQTKGAVGVIICAIVGVNGGDGESVFGMAGGDNADLVTIPTVSFKKSDCDKIKLALSNNIDVIVTMQERENNGPDFNDGTYDNGIIAHEFGHGISNRLVGGPSQSGCLNADEQMGEGWSDFFSLVLSVEEGDTGADARGIGTYAIGESVEGRGIRRFPYSTDMNINPQTFDDIKGTTAPHPLGEIWVSCLWDLHWALIDQYGYDADWANTESGNSKAVQLVIEGLKLTECSGGFIAGRDAILAADGLLFDGIHNCLIWEVFARRGLGFFADGGDPDDRNDGVENFEPRPTCIESIKLRKSASSFIEAGDEITIILRVTNHVPQTLTGVVVTDEIPVGATFVAGSSSIPGTVSGDIVSFDLGEMAYEDEVTFTYNIQTPADMKSTSLNFYDFEDGGEEWDVTQEEGFTTWSVNFDAFKSSETSFHISEEEADNDHSLVSPTLSVSGDKPALKFWHRYLTQSGIDGGFIQISTDGGLTWKFTSEEDFIRNGYNSVIAYGTLAIPSLGGYTGNSNDNFVDSYLDLSEYNGQDIKVRFRYGSDETGTSGDAIFGGWFVDDVELVDLLSYKSKACVTESTSMHGTCTLPTETIVNSDTQTSSKDINFNHFGVNVSPNPASNYVTIQATSTINEVANVSITSMEGKIVHTSKMNVSPSGNIHAVNTASYPAGFYIVKVQNGLNQTSQKLVIK